MSRRLSLLIVAIVWWAVPASAQMSFVQGDCDEGNLFAGTNAYVYTYPAAIGTGNLGIITVGTAIRTVSSVAGTSTTYSINGANQNNASAAFNNSQWKAIGAGSDTTVTITLSGNTADTAHVCYLEFSGANSDQSGSVANGSSNDNTQTHNSGSVTPPSAHNVVVASMKRTQEASGWNEDAGFTNMTTGLTSTEYAIGYMIQTSATAQESNVTTDATNEYSAMRIGAFAGTSGGGATARRLTLLGVGDE